MRNRVVFSRRSQAIALALLLAVPAAAARAARSSHTAGYTGDVQGTVTGLRFLKNRLQASLDGAGGLFTYGGPLAQAIHDVTDGSVGDGSTVTLTTDAYIRVFTPATGDFAGTPRAFCGFTFTHAGATYVVQVGYPNEPGRQAQGDVSGDLSTSATLTFDNDPFVIKKRGSEPGSSFEIVVAEDEYAPASFTVTTSRE